jgi:hypothetical protein
VDLGVNTCGLPVVVQEKQPVLLQYLTHRPDLKLLGQLINLLRGLMEVADWRVITCGLPVVVQEAQLVLLAQRLKEGLVALVRGYEHQLTGTQVLCGIMRARTQACANSAFSVTSESRDHCAKWCNQCVNRACPWL